MSIELATVWHIYNIAKKRNDIWQADDRRGDRYVLQLASGSLM